MNTLEELEATLGMPPGESKGVECAIQTLLFEQELIYFRVEEEGFSTQDYLVGLEHLQHERHLTAICLPGVGDAQIIEASAPICSLVLLSESDLYDYLTTR